MQNLFLQPNNFESVMLLVRESILLLRDIAQEQEPDGEPLTDEVERIASEYDVQKGAHYEITIRLERMKTDFWEELHMGVGALMDQAITGTEELLEFQE